MRKILLSLTALAALTGAGLVSNANAAPVLTDGATVQTLQYYGGEGWRHREWRHHEHWRRAHYWHRAHDWHRRGW